MTHKNAAGKEPSLVRVIGGDNSNLNVINCQYSCLPKQPFYLSRFERAWNNSPGFQNSSCLIVNGECLQIQTSKRENITFETRAHIEWRGTKKKLHQ